MIRRRNVLSAAELQAIVDSWSDGDEDDDETGLNDGRNADAIDIIIRPPEDVDNVSDVEEIDDNVQILNDENIMPREMAGQFEVEYLYDDGNEHIPASIEDEEYVEEEENNEEEEDNYEEEEEAAVVPPKRRRGPPVKQKAKEKVVKTQQKAATWTQNEDYVFDKEPFDDTANSYKSLFALIGKQIEYELI